MSHVRSIRPIVIGMLALSIPLLTACSGLMSGTSSLQGEWVLENGSDAEGVFIDSVQPITITFEGDAVSGQAPCNPFSGPIVRGPGTSSSGAIEFGGLERTEMGCAEQEQNVLEGRFFLALETVDEVAVSADGETLELIGDGILLSFERSENREG